jgi:hypothetical protein
MLNILKQLELANSCQNGMYTTSYHLGLFQTFHPHQQQQTSTTLLLNIKSLVLPAISHTFFFPQLTSYNCFSQLDTALEVKAGPMRIGAARRTPSCLAPGSRQSPVATHHDYPHPPSVHRPLLPPTTMNVQWL